MISRIIRRFWAFYIISGHFFCGMLGGRLYDILGMSGGHFYILFGFLVLVFSLEGLGSFV